MKKVSSVYILASVSVVGSYEHQQDVTPIILMYT